MPYFENLKIYISRGGQENHLQFSLRANFLIPYTEKKANCVKYKKTRYILKKGINARNTRNENMREYHKKKYH